MDLLTSVFLSPLIWNRALLFPHGKVKWAGEKKIRKCNTGFGLLLVLFGFLKFLC